MEALELLTCCLGWMSSVVLYCMVDVSVEPDPRWLLRPSSEGNELVQLVAVMEVEAEVVTSL